MAGITIIPDTGGKEDGHKSMGGMATNPPRRIAMPPFNQRTPLRYRTIPSARALA